MIAKLKEFLTPKVWAAIIVIISSILGINEASDHYSIEPIAQPINIVMPDKDWTPLINQISEKRDNAHLEEYHGGR